MTITMKNFTILFVAISLCLASCNKDHVGGCAEAEKISLTDAVVVSRGALVFSSLTKVNGIAKIYLQKNGRYVLGLEQVNVHSDTELVTYLSATPSLSATSIPLFSFKNISSERFNLLPANINGSSFGFVIIQGDTTPQPEAVAGLN